MVRSIAAACSAIVKRPLWELRAAVAGGFDPHAQPALKYALDQRTTC
jgi:hypothetical protein